MHRKPPSPTTFRHFDLDMEFWDSVTEVVVGVRETTTVLWQWKVFWNASMRPFRCVAGRPT